MNARIHELPTRISFKAYSVNHRVEVNLGEQRHDARLIDISSSGARIALARTKTQPYRLGQAVGVNVRLTDKGVESGAIPGTVNWIQEGEIEVAFARPLTISTREMQSAVG